MTGTDDDKARIDIKGRKATGCAVAVLAWAALLTAVVCGGALIALWEALR